MDIFRPYIFIALALLLSACATLPESDDETKQNVLKPVISVPLDPDKPVEIHYVLSSLAATTSKTATAPWRPKTPFVQHEHLIVPQHSYGRILRMQVEMLEGNISAIAKDWLGEHQVEFQIEDDTIVLHRINTRTARTETLTSFPAIRLRYPAMRTDFHTGTAQSFYQATWPSQVHNATSINKLSIVAPFPRHITDMRFNNIVHRENMTQFEQVVKLREDSTESTLRVRFTFTKPQD